MPRKGMLRSKYIYRVEKRIAELIVGLYKRKKATIKYS